MIKKPKSVKVKSLIIVNKCGYIGGGVNKGFMNMLFVCEMNCV